MHFQRILKSPPPTDDGIVVTMAAFTRHYVAYVSDRRKHLYLVILDGILIFTLFSKDLSGVVKIQILSLSYFYVSISGIFVFSWNELNFYLQYTELKKCSTKLKRYVVAEENYTQYNIMSKFGCVNWYRYGYSTNHLFLLYSPRQDMPSLVQL